MGSLFEGFYYVFVYQILYFLLEWYLVSLLNFFVLSLSVCVSENTKWLNKNQEENNRIVYICCKNPMVLSGYTERLCNLSGKVLYIGLYR